MRLTFCLSFCTLVLASVSQAKIIDTLSCQSTSTRANIQKLSLHRDDQLPMGKNLIVRMETLFDGEPIENELDHGFDSTPTSTRLKIAENDHHTIYFFDARIGGNFSGAGAQHRYAALLEEKASSPSAGSIGSQIEFLDCN